MTNSIKYFILSGCRRVLRNAADSAFALLFPAMVLLPGCLSVGPPANNYRNFSHLLEHLEDHNLQVDRVERVLYDMIRAENGFAFYIDDVKVEFYRYDWNNPEQRQCLDEATENGFITILGARFPAIVQGSFIMLGWQSHPRRDELLAVFKKFN